MMNTHGLRSEINRRWTRFRQGFAVAVEWEPCKESEDRGESGRGCRKAALSVLWVGILKIMKL